jgi:hypothetical protein
MLGADHHGYINRLRATAACAGDNPDYNIDVLIGQLVKIMEGGQEVKLSKRAGTIITLEELVEKVGVDAARYTLIRYPVDTPMVMDIDILKRNTNGNPKYAFAFKMMLDENIIQTEVENVEWNVSKWGVLKPRIKIKEINIGGVNINYTSGFNAKFIKDNKINKGSLLKITRSGDVIPFIIEVVSKSEMASMPDIKYNWIASGILFLCALSSFWIESMLWFTLGAFLTLTAYICILGFNQRNNGVQ